MSAKSQAQAAGQLFAVTVWVREESQEMAAQQVAVRIPKIAQSKGRKMGVIEVEGADFK